MASLAQFGNDLYTGKRSVDFVRRQKTWYALSGVLYFLASGNVRGFAFTLGVTTLIDLAVVFLFTHPVVAMLAHTKFFGGGHKWSGLDPERLGAKTRYVGRGRFVRAEPKAKTPATVSRSRSMTPTEGKV